MSKLAQKMKDSKIIETKKENDTIRIWESYREQALLWRTLTIFQLPVTFIAILFGLIMWLGSNPVINVPEKPLPGQYTLQALPDSEFINVATSYVNLIATYQSSTARRQFGKARESLIEPVLTQFDKEMLIEELRAIESSKITQIFFADPTKTSLERGQGQVKVKFTGDRVRYISGRQFPTTSTRYEVTMKTIPRNTFNPYGIVITNVIAESLS
jgi:hypothetical protein